MKKLLLGALLLLSIVSFSQVPSYLTDNNIQWSIKPTSDGNWWKLTNNGVVSYVFMMDLRNENYKPFMNECHKVLTYYGLKYPSLNDNQDSGFTYDDGELYTSFYHDNVNDYDEFTIQEIRMLVYAYLVGDRKKIEIYDLPNKKEIVISIMKNTFMIRISDTPKSKK